MRQKNKQHKDFRSDRSREPSDRGDWIYGRRPVLEVVKAGQRHLYEAVLETELDKRNFRKKVLGFGLLVPLKETQMAGRHRPAQLFRFDADKYEKLKKRGFNFEV